MRHDEKTSAGRTKMLSGGDTGDRLAEVNKVPGCLVVQTVEHHEAKLERDPLWYIELQYLYYMQLMLPFISFDGVSAPSGNIAGQVHRRVCMLLFAGSEGDAVTGITRHHATCAVNTGKCVCCCLQAVRETLLPALPDIMQRVQSTLASVYVAVCRQ